MPRHYAQPPRPVLKAQLHRDIQGLDRDMMSDLIYSRKGARRCMIIMAIAAIASRTANPRAKPRIPSAE
ncbi:hypothetical protein SPHINGO361_140195 [Sphingomonas sp. EC-HK361]|nr:hypothetical protein SPHINGO361_140195 [Sphingomonas sp. EC-HK361]